MEVITVANTDIQIVEYNGERVLTTKQLADGYECDPSNIKKNFNDNRERFIERTHFFKLEGEALQNLRVTNSDLQISPMTRSLYLWTKRGAARHSKMLGTDRAWDMFDMLEENYFNPPKQRLQQDSYMIADPVERALKWAEEQKAHRKEVALLEADKATQAQIIGELKPKADYTDRILQSKGLVAITAIAKDYGMSGTAMNQKLHELKIIYKMGDQWLLYAKYQASGYTHSETIELTHANGTTYTKMNTKWTQKGRLFLYQSLKKKGILPVIERQIIDKEQSK